MSDVKKPETMHSVIHAESFEQFKIVNDNCGLALAPEPGRVSLGRLTSSVQRDDGNWEVEFELTDPSDLTESEKGQIYRAHSQAAKEDPAFAATLEPVYDAMMERRRKHGYPVPPFAERADA